MNDSTISDTEHQEDLVVEELEEQVKPPPLYRVVIMNDDYTPMEFVVHVLETFFGMDFDKAYRIMMTVHTSGKGVVGMYPKDIAETKSEQVNSYARQNGHPLLTTVEKTE